MPRRAATLFAATMLAACAGAGPSAGAPATTVPQGANASAPLPAALAPGRGLVEAVCLTCHSLRPPHKTAPPLAMIATQYLAAESDSAAAAQRIAAWARDPDPARSLLPAHAIERFGLMPALGLPEADLRNAAAYILTVRDTAGSGRGGMAGMHGGGPRGMGGGHGGHRP